MKDRISDNTRITMTVGQLKRLVGNPINADFSAAAEDMQGKALVCEMARVGDVNGKLEAHVRYKERLGQGIPHIHIWDSNSNGRQKHVCVRLQEARYFKHDAATDTLNAAEKEDFVRFLKAKSEDFPELENNYRVAIRMWNANNSSSKVDPDTPMPDYTNIADG